MVTVAPAISLDRFQPLLLEMVKEIFGDFASWRHKKEENARLRDRWRCSTARTLPTIRLEPNFGRSYMPKYGKQMGNEISGIQSGELGYDPNDPAFTPIDGVDCDTYARIMGGLQKNSVMGPENVEAYVTNNGVKPGTWGDVSMGWTARMQQYQHVANRIGTLMSQTAM